MRIHSLLFSSSLGLSLLAAGCGSDTQTCGGEGVICTVMGTGLPGLGEDGVPPEDVNLYLPQDLVFSPDDNSIYVMDWNNHRVRTVDADGHVQTVIGTGYLGDAPDGPVLNASLNHPTHATFTPDGHLMLSAWHNSKLIEVDLAAGRMQTICGDGSRAYRGDGGPAEEAWLDLPVAAVFDSSGRLFVSDQANQRIRMIDANGIIDTVVGPPADYLPPTLARVCATDPETGTETCKVCLATEAENPDCAPQPVGKPQGFAGDGGPANEALLYLPFSQSAPPAGRIDFGPDDTLYITDTGNHRIRAVTPDGIIDTVAGKGPATFDPTFRGGYEGDGGPATDAMLSRPTDVAVDGEGNFYIADTDNSCVRRVDGATGIITTAAGVCGQRGFDGDDGPATEALLNRPYGVALDADGNLYIADTHNHRIRVVYMQ
jgi:DNA-binding beta-propeller fold protein YncE